RKNHHRAAASTRIGLNGLILYSFKQPRFKLATRALVVGLRERAGTQVGFEAPQLVAVHGEVQRAARNPRRGAAPQQRAHHEKQRHRGEKRARGPEENHSFSSCSARSRSASESWRFILPWRRMRRIKT